MKLSDAIRLGALLHPQCFGSMTRWRYGGELPSAVGDDEVIGTCALGAAEAAGYGDVFYSGDADMACPECPQWTNGLAQVIAHLNDWHRWSREAIADWVATVEPADPDAATSLDADSHHRAGDAVPVGSQSR